MSSRELARVLEERTGVETKVVVLGYIQRGGTPTCRDRMLASQVGYRAVKLLKEDSSSRAIGIRGNEIFDMDLEEALKMQRITDTSLIRLAEILA
jgi:6-phosphofructokinase 1